MGGSLHAPRPGVCPCRGRPEEGQLGHGARPADSSAEGRIPFHLGENKYPGVPTWDAGGSTWGRPKEAAWRGSSYDDINFMNREGAKSISGRRNSVGT